MNDATPRQLRDLPLWRLLVMLHDAERIAGPDSQTARILARRIRERMRVEDAAHPLATKGGADV